MGIIIVPMLALFVITLKDLLLVNAGKDFKAME